MACDRVVGGARHDRAGDRRRADERAGLARVHGAQPVGVERDPLAGRLAGGLQIDRLAADHAGGARGVAPITSMTRSLRAASAGSRGRRLAREQRERLGVQAVAGENRHAVAVDDVQRRPAAPQRVVVHRGQVVVDERVGVNQLDRARGGQRAPCAAAPASRRRRATASAAASVRIGRRRLPPANTL